MLITTVFVCGAVVMSLEMLAFRILAPWFGSSIFATGSIITVFLAGLSLGYWLGGFLADRKASFAVLALLILIPALMVMSLPLFYKASNEAIFDRVEDVRWGALAASGILFFLPAILLGTISPYCIKLSIDRLATVGTRVGSLYAISTMGSIFGTLFTSFYLIAWLSVPHIVLCEAGLLVVLSGVLYAYHFAVRSESKETEERDATVGEN